MKKFLLVDDHEDFRATVKSFLALQLSDVVLLEAVDGDEAIALAVKERPDIVLMDLRLPGINGLDAAIEIHKKFPECRIIALTMFESETFRRVFKSSEVCAYIGKSELYEKLIPTIQAISCESSVAR